MIIIKKNIRNLKHKIDSVIYYNFRIIGIRGALFRAVSFFIGIRSPEYRIYCEKLSTYFNLRLGTTDVVCYDQIINKENYNNIGILPGNAIIDAGANIGITTVLFAVKFPNSKIYAIEPDINNFKLLRKNTCTYTNVTPINAAVWKNENGVIVLDLGRGNWSFQTVESGSGTYDRINIIESISISKLISKYNISRVGLLKLDIEGSEKEILDNSADWIDKVDILCVELHDRYREGCYLSYKNATTKFRKHWKEGEKNFSSRF